MTVTPILKGATAVSLLCLLSAGCSSDTKDTSTGNAPTQSASSTTAGASQTLNGAGATFPLPLYQKWFQEYQAKTGVQINYQAIGSGGGIKAITEKTVDFGASDAPMSDAELKAAPNVIHIPTVAGAVVVAYNLPGTPPNLHLSGDVIANIFLGKIKTWNDPSIAALNPGAKLPGTAISAFHRADGSGTTNVFTTYLSQVSPSWKQQVGAGKSVRWPGGIGGNKSGGVAALIQQNAGGVGYVELNYALQNKISFAAVQNAQGKFISPSVESTTAAATGVPLPPDFRKVITNTTAANGYPITGFTFLLVDKNAKPDVKKFLVWALNDGQKDAPGMAYAPLPASVQKQALAAVDTIQ